MVNKLNESERVWVVGGYRDPYRIYFSGKLSTRYAIEKRKKIWYLIDNEQDEEVLLTLAGLGDEDDVRVRAVG